MERKSMASESSEISRVLRGKREGALQQQTEQEFLMELNRQTKREEATAERHKKLQYYYRNKHAKYEQSLKELEDRKEAIKLVKKQLALQQNAMHRLIFKLAIGDDSTNQVLRNIPAGQLVELLYNTQETRIGVQGPERILPAEFPVVYNQIHEGDHPWTHGTSTLQNTTKETAQSQDDHVPCTDLRVTQTPADIEWNEPFPHSVMHKHKESPSRENDLHVLQSCVLPLAGTSPCISNMHEESKPVYRLLGGHRNRTTGPLLTSSVSDLEHMDLEISSFAAAIIKTIMLEIQNAFLNSSDDLDRLPEVKNTDYDQLSTIYGSLDSSTKAECVCVPSVHYHGNRSSEELSTYYSTIISPKSKGTESVGQVMFGTADLGAKMIPRVTDLLATYPESFSPGMPHTENTHPGIWQPDSKLDSIALHLIESAFERFMVLDDGHEGTITQTTEAGNEMESNRENVSFDKIQTDLNREPQSSARASKKNQVKSKLVHSDLAHLSSQTCTINTAHAKLHIRNQQRDLDKSKMKHVSVEDFQDKLGADKQSKSSVGKGVSGPTPIFMLPPMSPEKTVESSDHECKSLEIVNTAVSEKASHQKSMSFKASSKMYLPEITSIRLENRTPSIPHIEGYTNHKIMSQTCRKDCSSFAMLREDSAGWFHAPKLCPEMKLPTLQPSVETHCDLSDTLPSTAPLQSHSEHHILADPSTGSFVGIKLKPKLRLSTSAQMEKTAVIKSKVLSHLEHCQDDLTKQRGLLNNIKTKPNYCCSISPSKMKNTKHVAEPFFQNPKTFIPTSSNPNHSSAEKTGSSSESDGLTVHNLSVLLAGLSEKIRTIRCRRDIIIHQLRTQICPLVHIGYDYFSRERDLVESVCRIICQAALKLTQAFQRSGQTEAVDMNFGDVGPIKFSRSSTPLTPVAEDIVEMVFEKLVEILQNDQPLIQDYHSAASEGRLDELNNLTPETIIQGLIHSVIFKLKHYIKNQFCPSFYD